MLENIPKIEKPAETANLQSLELKANLNPEQKGYLEMLKAKANKILGNKTVEDLEKAKDIASLRKYKEILQEILEFLKTKEMHLSEMEKIFTPEEYERKIDVLKETGILRQFENGKWGIVDILGQESPVPSYVEIIERMEAKPELLEKKREQGFTELFLVPLGMKLSEIIDRTSDLIVKKHKEGNLLGTDGQKLELDEDKPVDVNDIYENADVKGDLIYFPRFHAKDKHVDRGQTKEEILKDEDNSNPGWQVILLEDLPDLPGQGKGKFIADRKQIEAGETPMFYLMRLQEESQYQHEKFTTPETELIYFMNYLYKHNQAIDDPHGNGKVSCGLGAYFNDLDLVPLIGWDRDFKQLKIYDDLSVNSSTVFFARSSVII